MKIEEAITSRYSARAFLPTEVPRRVVEEILDLAARTPSGNNVQPWRVYAVEGEAKAALSRAVLERREQRPWPKKQYVSSPRPLPEPYKSRSRQNGIALYSLLGIGKGDEEGHQRQQRRNYQFFDAPIGLFFFIDEVLELGSWLDCGMFIQSVMLAARGAGLHTCPQGAWTNFHPVVREHVGAAPDETLICGMALGFADPSAPVNSLEVPRVGVGEFTRWVD